MTRDEAIAEIRRQFDVAIAALRYYSRGDNLDADGHARDVGQVADQALAEMGVDVE